MDCIFCKIGKKEIPSKVLYEDDLVIAIMDVNPVVDGHTLIIPKKHYTDYLELDEDILKHVLEVADTLGNKITKKLNSKGLTFLVNYGKSQQVKHFHLHILPDYKTREVHNKRDIEENFKIITN